MEDGSFRLPPLLERFENGQAIWKGFEGVDFEIIGLFLSSHLIVEHYLDEYLAAYSPAPFSWEAAKLTFGQKVALISNLKQFPEPWVIPATLKHFNSLRNKLSHDVSFVLSAEVLLPEVQFLQKVSSREGLGDLDAPAKIIQEFASLVCVYLASAITYCAEQKHNGQNGRWKL